ncbi:MAG: DegT/DnrJ/EryC1/StrS family aminotransferase [Bryobacterales bacterium]|nr:DegT/DnrJ/EryC1/StrS family aminotransferase [Bryobacterales bacterium]
MKKTKTPVRIPPIDFGALIDDAAPAWRERLAELFARKHFILGPQLAAFEQEWGAFAGGVAVGVANGTDAIELALRDAGVNNSQQEVLTTALTAPFTGIGICGTGARIRFCDVDPETLLMDPRDAAQRLTRRTAAIVPVHLYGQACDLDALRTLARSAGAVLMQDAAQAHGATWRGKPLAAYGPYVTYSFYPTKNLGALGDGGAIVAKSAAVARRLTSWRDGGRKPGGQISYFVGRNSRLDELHCCYLRAFLTRLADWNADRRRLAARYDAALAECPGIRLVKTGEGSVRHLYVIRTKRRAALRDYLASRGIFTGIHYPVPLHLMPAFAGAGLKRGSLPNAEQAAREVLSLPLYPRMPDAFADETAAAIRAFFKS